jgi:ABC-type glycerol-3-phosphate transport system permease component
MANTAPVIIQKKSRPTRGGVYTAIAGAALVLISFTTGWIIFSGKKVAPLTIYGLDISKQLSGIGTLAPYALVILAVVTIGLAILAGKQKLSNNQGGFSFLIMGALGLFLFLFQISLVKHHILESEYSSTRYTIGFWGITLGFFIILVGGIIFLRNGSSVFHTVSGRVMLYAILILGAIIAIYPFIWMISTSLMTLGETILKKPLPSNPQWVNYKDAWTGAKFANYFLNSIIITLTTMAGLLATSILAGYAFARIKFLGRNLIFSLLLATMMIPESVTIIPNFLMIRGDIIKMPGIPASWFEGFYNKSISKLADQAKNAIQDATINKETDPSRVMRRVETWVKNADKALSTQADPAKKDDLTAKLNKVRPILRNYSLLNSIYPRLTTILPYGSWLNSLAALSIPFMANAFSIFLLRQFFSKIPDDYWDAARIDGAGHLRFLIKIVLPMSKASIMTVLIFSFIGSWNAFLWPLLATTKETWRPLMVGLWSFVTEAGPQTQLLMAGAVITILPILLLYFLTQKQFTEGIATTGLKG